MSTATMADAQKASDEAMASQDKDLDGGLEVDANNENSDDAGSSVKPRNTQETLDTLQKLYGDIGNEVQKRKEANEEIAALREKAVTMGVSKKAQAAVEQIMKLNEIEQLYFDEAVKIYREALGKPIQGSLALVHSNDS